MQQFVGERTRQGIYASVIELNARQVRHPLCNTAMRIINSYTQLRRLQLTDKKLDIQPASPRILEKSAKRVFSGLASLLSNVLDVHKPSLLVAPFLHNRQALGDARSLRFANFSYFFVFFFILGFSIQCRKERSIGKTIAFSQRRVCVVVDRLTL